MEIKHYVLTFDQPGNQSPAMTRVESKKFSVLTGLSQERCKIVWTVPPVCALVDADRQGAASNVPFRLFSSTSYPGSSRFNQSEKGNKSPAILLPSLVAAGHRFLGYYRSRPSAFGAGVSRCLNEAQQSRDYTGEDLWSRCYSRFVRLS